MNSRTIQKLRRKFIMVAMITYFLVMVFMGVFINVSNFIVSHRQIRLVLNYILENDGMLNVRFTDRQYPAAAGNKHDKAGRSASDNRSEPDNLSLSEKTESDTLSTISTAESILSAVMDDELNDDTSSLNSPVLEEFSPEFHISARYFTATFTDTGELSELHTTHMNELSDDDAAVIAKAAYDMETKFGRLGYYYFEHGTTSSGEDMIVLLNCASQINSNARVLRITALIGGAGLLFTFLLVFIFSHRVIQPEIENVRRQKQFITNASHELKTPLAVIRANTEIEEMINGESEWTQSTMRQVERLDGLVQNLVMISRAAEREDRSVMTEIDVTKNVEESVSPYRSLAQQEKKELVLNLQENIRMVADESKIRQLATLLIDNAFKYCDENGTVAVTLDTIRKGKTVRLIVSNTFTEGANVDYSRFFERFYREDESHNVDKGGYGIGLSIAESICQQYGGSIQVSWKNDEILFTCLLT